MLLLKTEEDLYIKLEESLGYDANRKIISISQFPINYSINQISK